MSKEYIYSNATTIIQLPAEDAFNQLTSKQKLYAHYMSKACWYGSLVVLFQTSPESPLIFSLVHQLFRNETVDQLKKKAVEDESKLSEEEFDAFLVYVSAFYANMGNYRGFGDKKIVPNLPQEKFEDLIKLSRFYKSNPAKAEPILEQVKDRMYSLGEGQKHLGFPPNGRTAYFSSNCGPKDAESVKALMKKTLLEGWNTRLFKHEDKKTYEIRLASVLESNDAPFMREINEIGKTPNQDGYKFSLTRGDYSGILSHVVDNLSKAKEYAANETEMRMIEHYIEHFRTGNINLHKSASREWIKDKGPVVESYIGFVENYRDPDGIRSEFEGFVAMVHKERSKMLKNLVDNAPRFLSLLPWGKDFEKDTFLQPDFTSLDVLTLAGSSIWSGINIPNYEEIRQNEGFKNVSFGNIIGARLKEKSPNFLDEKDAPLMENHSLHAFTVQVGIHELLGHGSGKFLRKNADGAFNFDPDKVINPLTGEKVKKWYKPGESWGSVFSSLGPPIEECRAEAVGIFLSLEPSVLEIFGHLPGPTTDDIVYVNWLSLVYSGLTRLDDYDPTSQKWLQAHSQGRYVIARMLIATAPELVKVEYIEESPKDGKEDLIIRVNRKLISSVGRKAVRDFLLKVQVFKSTADVDSARELFMGYSQVSDSLEYPYLKFRKIILARKKPEKLIVQPSTLVSTDKGVSIKVYPSSTKGLIESMLDHIDDAKIYSAIETLVKKDAKYFKSASTKPKELTNFSEIKTKRIP